MAGLDFLVRSDSCPECTDELGPPPDYILSIPPPPYFFELDPNNESVSPSCSSQCVWAPQSPGVEYKELPRHSHTTDDTWLLVVGAACLGVLLLGALLALVLLKCRAKITSKSSMQLASSIVKTKPGKGCESVLYPYPMAPPPDSRVLWATLTPRGTTHITLPAYSSPCKPTLPPPDPPVTFDNTGYIDSDSQTPLMESYQLSELLDSDSTSTSSSTLKKSPRPRVSTPTRIENPNLPPLNLHPHRSMRRATLQRRDSNDQPCPSPL